MAESFLFYLQTKRAIGVKRAMLLKKRQRSATQPITAHEVFAAKSADKKPVKAHDDLDLPAGRPFRGRLLSVPTTVSEIREVKNNSPPQKTVKPPVGKEPEKKQRKTCTSTAKPVKKKSVSSRIDSGRSSTTPTSKTTANKSESKSSALTSRVSAANSKVDIGRSPLSRNTTGRASLRTKPDSRSPSVRGEGSTKGSISSLVEDKHSSPTRPMRRSASVRVSGNVSQTAAAGIKAAAERANALVEAKKKAAEEKKAAEMKYSKVNTKVTEALRAKAQPRVDSRRTSNTNVSPPTFCLQDDI